MALNRRAGLRALLWGAASLAVGSVGTASADVNVKYTYDPLGRLIGVTYPDGSGVAYTYDAAGNRTQVVQAAPFSSTIAITGTGPVNLRTLANAAGYAGVSSATITFTVASGVTITGQAGANNSGAGGIAIDTGIWPTGVTVQLTLQNSGVIRGGGGGGGMGSRGENGVGYPGDVGGVGGDAIYARVPLTITNTGAIQAGGGGGGGGGGWRRSQIVDGFPEVTYTNGGGGGGGFPNGNYGDAGTPSDGEVSSHGAVGTTSGGGAGGAGGTASAGRTTGAGGGGGGAAASGASGAAASGSTGTQWTKISEGAGGSAGYAIRKNGNTVTVTNSGTISGTVG